MGKKGDRITGSNRDKVLAFLRANPGSHRCVEIGEGTGLTTLQAAHACYQVFISRPGEIMRGTRPAANGNRPHQTYAAAPAQPVGAPVQDEHTPT